LEHLDHTHVPELPRSTGPQGSHRSSGGCCRCCQCSRRGHSQPRPERSTCWGRALLRSRRWRHRPVCWFVPERTFI